MDPIYRKCILRRIAEAMPKSCYIDRRKVILENETDHIIIRNGIHFNLTPLSDELASQIDEVLKSCEQRQKQVASGV